MENLSKSIQDLTNKIIPQDLTDSTPSPSDYEEREAKIGCPKHGTVKFIQTYYKLLNDWTPESNKCPECTKEAEFKRQKEEVEKTKEAERQKAIKDVKIPLRFEDKSFDNFKVSEVEKGVFDICKRYAEKFPELLPQGTSLILCGNTGAGKTHLACAIARYVAGNHYKHEASNTHMRVMFIEVLKAIRTVKQTYTKGAARTEQQAIDSFVHPDLLILDEVGVQFGSDTEKMILFEIMNERYLAMRPTILISNLSVKALKEFIGERVVDRMKENKGTILVFDWESKRAS
jgi:DNA replication protein DnaC